MYRDIFTLINFFLYQDKVIRVFFFENTFIEPHLTPYVFKGKCKEKTIIISLYKIENKNLKNFRIFQFKKLFFLNLLFLFLKIRYCYSSTPDIDNSAFQKSIFKKTKYIYIQHSPLSLTKIYRDNAFTNFDVVQVINIFQKNDIISISKIKEKKIKPWRHKYLFLEHQDKTYLKFNININKKKKILIAPTWGTDFFDLYIHLLIKENLNQNKYDLFIRPHIMSILKDQSLLQNLVEKKFQISKGRINLHQFDMLITDWSGIYIEFAKINKIKSILIQDKEKILNNKFFEFKNIPIDTYARTKLGVITKLNELNYIENKIEDIFQNQQKYTDDINKFFKDYFY